MMRSTDHQFSALLGRMIGRWALVAFGVIGLVFILLTTGGIDHLTVAAQGPYQWSPDQRVFGYLDDTYTPYIIADQNRTVHAFASQWVGEEDRQLAIVYSQWTLEGGWTAPVDIMLSPTGEAQVQGAFLDQAGTMHLIFWGGDAFRGSGIYYSSALVVNAGQAPAWSAPRLVGERAGIGSAALTGDNHGNLVVIYSGNMEGNGVYAVGSSDAGDSWSEPTTIFLTYDPELLPYSLDLYMGPSGRAHAVWNVVTSLGVDVSVHYARLDIETGQWSEPIVLEERTIDDEDFFGPSFPSISGNGDNVVVMYNSGNPAEGGYVPRGRPVQRSRLSSDGGLTWQNPVTPFPRHVGRSGEHALAADSEGVVHTVFIQRIEIDVNGDYGIIGGIWHSELRDGRWSEPDRFATTYSPHDVRAVVDQGNVLLVVWREDPGAGQHGTWYSYATLDTPELPEMPVPSPSATPVPTTPTATPPEPAATPSHLPPSISQEDVPEAALGNPAIPLVVGIVPVVLLIAGIIVVHQFNYSRR
jgi:hypothetical protein